MARRTLLLGFVRVTEDLIVELWEIEDGMYKYATWLYNRSDKGWHCGHYFKTEDLARDDFRERAKKALGR